VPLVPTPPATHASRSPGWTTQHGQSTMFVQHGRPPVYNAPLPGRPPLGVYEEVAPFFDMAIAVANFRYQDKCHSNSEVLRGSRCRVRPLPMLQTAQVLEFSRRLRDDDTADVHQSSFPAPGVEGFYFASACTCRGLSISPTSRGTQHVTSDGTPPFDLAPMSVHAATSKRDRWSEVQLQPGCRLSYRHF